MIPSLKDEIKRKKSFLKGYRNYLIRIERLEEKLSEIDNQLMGLQSKRISDMPRGGVPITADDLLSRKEETMNRIQTLVVSSKKVKAEIYEVIDRIDDYRFAEVLESYFIECQTLEDIAAKKHYSIRHVSTLFGEGLRKAKINDGGREYNV